MDALANACASLDARLEYMDQQIRDMPVLFWQCRDAFAGISGALCELASESGAVRTRLGRFKEMFQRSWQTVGCQTEEIERYVNDAMPVCSV